LFGADQQLQCWRATSAELQLLGAVSLKDQPASGAQGLDGAAMHLCSQAWLQVHPDRYHQIEAVGLGIKALEVVALAVDGDPSGGGELLGFAQAHRAEILRYNAMAEAGQIHRIAAFSFGEAKGIPWGQGAGLEAKEVVWL
jgi:hypothetical protein